MITNREARAIIRKRVRRVPEGEEIRYINIMPMMDIMTILLVAVIGLAAASPLSNLSSKAKAPNSFTQQKREGEHRTIIISQDAIIVDLESDWKVPLDRGLVTTEFLEDENPNSRNIPKLGQLLGRLRTLNNKRLAEENKPIPEIPELWILADRTIPYQTLLRVMYTALQKEAGYRRFRLIVIGNVSKSG